MGPGFGHLGEQASIVGPDFEARRRAAWVGMCVLTDWSPVVERTETTDDSTLVTVSLYDYLNGPDRVLLQQISTAWERLRSTFGEEVITRLSGRFRESGQDAAWNWLALVASENPTLERELERELTTNVHVRSSSGILLWVARRRNESSDAFRSICDLICGATNTSLMSRWSIYWPTGTDRTDAGTTPG